MSTESKSRADLLSEMRKVIADGHEADTDKATATIDLHHCQAQLRAHPERNAQPRPRRVQLLMAREQSLKTELKELKEQKALLIEKARVYEQKLDEMIRLEEEEHRGKQYRGQSRDRRR